MERAVAFAFELYESNMRNHSDAEKMRTYIVPPKDSMHPTGEENNG